MPADTGGDEFYSIRTTGHALYTPEQEYLCYEEQLLRATESNLDYRESVLVADQVLYVRVG